MTTLVRDGLELRYKVRGGSGPALLLPHLNFSWPDYLDLSPFTERFTVITASPRGFATSSRLDADIPYRVRDMLPGQDHDGMLTHLNDAVPTVLAWLDQL